MEKSIFVCFLLWCGGSFALLLLTVAPAASATVVCPERCDCQHSQSLLCGNRGLRAVPKALPERRARDVRVLSLAGNFIHNVTAFDFTRYGDLTRLNLQFNQIRTIDPKAFDKLSKLEELYLGNNLISTIQPGTLQPLKKLTILYGNNNDIKTLTPESFGHLETVIKLRLDGNSIEVLQESVFKSLTNLMYLHLESNQLRHIHRSAFSKLTKLRLLNLSHNKQTELCDIFTFSHLRSLATLLLSDNEIRHVGNHVFQNLKKLLKLSLSNNRISRVDGEALRGLSRMRELLMAGNELTEITRGLLDPLEKLELLDLSDNLILRIDPVAFARLGHLRELRLKNNRLASLSGGVFAANGALSSLELAGNNWTCDCRLERLRRWMTQARSRGRLLATFVRCHQPAMLRGKYLDYVESSQLQLPQGHGNWNRSWDCNSEPEPEVEPMESRRGVMLQNPLPQEEGNREEEEREEERKSEEEGREKERKSEEEEREENGEEVGVQGDEGEREKTQTDRRKRKKAVSPRSQPAAEASGRMREKARGSSSAHVAPETAPFTMTAKTMPITMTTMRHHGNNRNHSNQPNSGTPAATVPSDPRRQRERFDLLLQERVEPQERAETPMERSGLPAVMDACQFNRHFVLNITVDQVTSGSATVHWTVREHHRYPGNGNPGDQPHFRVLFDRFGQASVLRFPRYVYAGGGARAVTLRELRPDSTYIACVEGVVGGVTCQVAPRDHCAGFVTVAMTEMTTTVAGGNNAATDLRLVTVATLAGNALLLLLVGGVWLGRGLRRRLRCRKSGHVTRHMMSYSTRRPFRSAAAVMATTSDFTSYQSGRPDDGGDLIQFPCGDRFLDNGLGNRRDNDMMQRFSD